jgi:hypothetical protein
MVNTNPQKGSEKVGFALAVPWGEQKPTRRCTCGKRGALVALRSRGEWYYALCTKCGARGSETLTKDCAALDWDKQVRSMGVRS